MGQILFAGGGGGTVGSDDLTATAKYVVQDMTYMGNDTDDDMGTGTCPDRRKTGTLGNLSSSNGSAVHKGNAVHQTTTTNNTGVVAIAPAEGYYDGNCYAAMPLADVRSAINYTDASKVVNTTTICGMTGTMANIAALDPMKSVTLSGSNLYVRMSKGAHITDASSGYPEVYGAATSFISALGVASITNFSVGQYSSKQLLFTWSQPSKGLWSGIRIVANQSRYPNNATDGTYWDSGSTWMATGTLNTGTWYIRAWNYITWSGGRYYGGYSQGSYYNAVVSGSQTFTSTQNWTVPNAVRSITAFLVGGGGGAYVYKKKANSASGGAGGGYTKTVTISVSPGQVLNITVGGGGTYQGGTSSIYRSGSNLASVSGGYGGDSTGSGGGKGFNGGSGGGGAQGSTSDVAYAVSGKGGTNGGNGVSAYIYNPLNHGSSYNYVSGGTGQGYSTKAWGDSGTAYAPGGGGAGYSADTCWDGTRGDGLTGNNSGAGANGIGTSRHESQEAKWNYGSSGIVMIKWG